MTQMPGVHEFCNAVPSAHPALGQAMGMVFQIAGSSSKVMIDPVRLAVLGQQLETGTAGQRSFQRQILLFEPAVAQAE